jgi:polyhydroxyalkanoate synthesis regulator phasin
MAGLGDIVQKAFYLGVGIASYAAEKAGGPLQELKVQAQKLADEMVSRGEMTAEEARKYVDELLQQAQVAPPQSREEPLPKEPRRIEIVSEDEEPTGKAEPDVENLRKQVQLLQDELRQIKKE